MAHILVIDDDDDVRTIFERFLGKFGHIVSSASGGREGLRLLKQDPPDVVITDILMPEMDGLEVILEIKKLYSKLAVHIPVIAMSGGISTRNAKAISFLSQAKTFGADRVFQKPVDFTGIHAAVQELLAASVA
jgi:CheY-like chemotaxis protein